MTDELEIRETRPCSCLETLPAATCGYQRCQAADVSGVMETDNIVVEALTTEVDSVEMDQGGTSETIRSASVDGVDMMDTRRREEQLENYNQEEPENVDNQEADTERPEDMNVKISGKMENNGIPRESNVQISEEGEKSPISEEPAEVGPEVRLRKNSIQERRKIKGPQGPHQALRLPVHRSFSSPRLSSDRFSDSGPDSAKSDPIHSPLGSSGSSGPKSPAMVMLSRVFNFHGLRSPSKKSPPCSPGGTAHVSRKSSSPSDSKKRKTLNFPLHHSPSPSTRKNIDNSRFSFEWSSRSSSSPKSSSSPISPGKDSIKKSPSSHLTGSKIKSRCQFYIPSPTGSSSSSTKESNSSFSPDFALNGTIEKIDGAGVLYRPGGSQTPGALRNHRRTRSDTFKLLEAKQAKTEVVSQRKRSRDDLECDTLPYDLRSKGVDGGLYTARGTGVEDRMRGEATGDYMLDLLERMSNYRIDDQRCSLPHPVLHTQQGMREGPGKPPPDKDEAPNKTSSRNRLEEVLAYPGPYPQVVLPSSGTYWDEHTTDADHTYLTSSSNNTKFETDEAATYYRRYFLGNEHWTYFGEDEVHGPVVLSHKREVISSQENLRVLLRLKTGTHHATIINLGDNPTPAKMVKRLKEELTIECFYPVVTPEGPELILAYDEHVLKNHFKFGLIYQRFGQTMEEQLFGNKCESRALEEFLCLMGQRVKLKDHEGFKGGLDTQFGQTGEESI